MTAGAAAAPECAAAEKQGEAAAALSCQASASLTSAGSIGAAAQKYNPYAQIWAASRSGVLLDAFTEAHVSPDSDGAACSSTGAAGGSCQQADMSSSVSQSFQNDFSSAACAAVAAAAAVPAKRAVAASPFAAAAAAATQAASDTSTLKDQDCTSHARAQPNARLHAAARAHSQHCCKPAVGARRGEVMAGQPLPATRLPGQTSVGFFSSLLPQMSCPASMVTRQLSMGRKQRALTGQCATAGSSSGGRPGQSGQHNGTSGGACGCRLQGQVPGVQLRRARLPNLEQLLLKHCSFEGVGLDDLVSNPGVSALNFTRFCWA